MTRIIQPDDWRPVDGLALESAALKAVRSTTNSMVIAGPGAGKTELLAQRASYLLQTGQCPSPRRILAISFKRDAATNLAERVEKRCGPELGRRLESRTYDAFAKSLVDRFRLAIPQDYRPTQDYIMVDKLAQAITRILEDLEVPRRLLPGGEWNPYQLKLIGQRHSEYSLPLPVAVGTDPVAFASKAVFRGLLGSTPSQLTFSMIGRLAEYLLRTNSALLKAVRSTYSHVFLDEFQDTTDVQLALIVTAFANSGTVLTAVGDHKQRIMGFANALPNAFGDFQRAFVAEHLDLIMNYRSARRLIEIQQYIAERLDPKAALVKPGRATEEEGICELLLFSDHKDEAQTLANLIQQWINNERLSPRDICILAKHNVDSYTQVLVEQLEQLGIKARLEAEYQELLKEPAVATVLSFLNLTWYRRAPESWAWMMQLIMDLRGYDADMSESRLVTLEQELLTFVNEMASELVGMNPQKCGGVEILGLFHRMFEFLGEDLYRSSIPQYRQGEYFDKVLNDCANLLARNTSAARDWGSAITAFEGRDAIPVMTVHKSKGLEYDTVVFVGLEDGAFFGFEREEIAETCAFFVAISRAKRRVYLTASTSRPSKDGTADIEQSSEKISPLYALLDEAGVPLTDCRR